MFACLDICYWDCDWFLVDPYFAVIFLGLETNISAYSVVFEEVEKYSILPNSCVCGFSLFDNIGKNSSISSFLFKGNISERFSLSVLPKCTNDDFVGGKVGFTISLPCKGLAVPGTGKVFEMFFSV